MWVELLVFYCFRRLFVGIRPQDHHNEHRLDQAVTMVVSILSGKFCGSSYECFTVWVGCCRCRVHHVTGIFATRPDPADRDKGSLANSAWLAAAQQAE